MSYISCLLAPGWMPIGPSVYAHWPLCGCLLAPVWIPIRGAHMCS